MVVEQKKGKRYIKSFRKMNEAIAHNNFLNRALNIGR